MHFGCYLTIVLGGCWVVGGGWSVMGGGWSVVVCGWRALGGELWVVGVG